MIRFTISWTIAKRERERRKGENEFLRKYIHMSEVWMERVQVVGHELSGKLWGEWTVDKCNCHLISQRQRGRTEAEDDKRFSRSDESAPDSASWYFGSWILHSALAADGEPRRCALQAAPPPPFPTIDTNTLERARGSTRNRTRSASFPLCTRETAPLASSVICLESFFQFFKWNARLREGFPSFFTNTL